MEADLAVIEETIEEAGETGSNRHEVISLISGAAGFFTSRSTFLLKGEPTI